MCLRQIVIILFYLSFIISPKFAVADELDEWLKAAASIFLQHETGHFVAGNGGDASIPSVRTGLDANRSDGSLFLSLGPTTGMSTAGVSSGSASFGYTLSGAFGLSYQLDTRSRPDHRMYGSALRERDGKMVWELPQPSFDNYIKDLKKWDSDVKRAEASVAGAGFVAQQAAIENGNLPLPIFKKALILSGMLKSGYPLYHYLFPGNTGDIARMAMVTPEALIVGALIVSASSDFLRGNMVVPSKLRIGFLSDQRTGAVGLIFSGVF